MTQVSNTPSVPLSRATEDWADAQLEAEFARLNPEIQRRVALRVLEIDALKREVDRLRHETEAWERHGQEETFARERLAEQLDAAQVVIREYEKRLGIPSFASAAQEST